MRCEVSPNYFLHGKVTKVDSLNQIYTVEFDEKDNAEPQQYTEDELQKIVSLPVVGIEGIRFVPYTDMQVYAYRGEIEEKATIVDVFKNGARLKWGDDGSLSTFCLPYNQLRPIIDDDEVKNDLFDNEGDLKKCNTGSMFVPYVGCTVLVITSNMVHPAKIVTVGRNDAEVRYDLCGRVRSVPYARMIPVLDHEIPRGKRRKCDQFRYVPNRDNSQQEYLHNEPVRKRSYREHSGTILESLSRHVRCVLNFRQSLITHRRTPKGLNDEVVTDDYHIYQEEWLGMRSKQRGLITTTCSDGTDTSILSNMPYIHPRCVLPPGEWTNFVKVTEAMKDFALKCIPKTNFPGVDVCLFDMCTCLDYGVEIDIRLANASQASMVVIFVPNVNECQATQKFIRKLYIKELVREEERIEKQRLEEIEEAERKQEEENKKNGIPSRKRKKSSHAGEGGER